LVSDRAIDTATDAVLVDLGRVLRAARDRADLTQEDLAERSKIDVKRIQRIEAGTVNVTIKTLVKIASALNLTLWQLLNERGRARSRRPH
jgi:transcriptional regulator with XRE-family HTH domain